MVVFPIAKEVINFYFLIDFRKIKKDGIQKKKSYKKMKGKIEKRVVIY